MEHTAPVSGQKRCLDSDESLPKRRRGDSEYSCSKVSNRQTDTQDISAKTSKHPQHLHINDLPQSILLRILRQLPLDDLLFRVCLVCKYWLDLSRDPDLWRHVDLRSQMKVTDDVLLRVTSLSDNVNFLDISFTKFVTSEGMVRVAKQCPRLQVLKLSSCSQLQSVAFLAIGEHCHRLQHLDLDCCFLLSDKDLSQISNGCRKLQCLKVQQCRNISDVGVKAIAENCSELRVLSLDQCSRVTDSAMLALTHSCPDLEELACMACDLKTEGLLSLTKLKKLKRLELPQVSHVNDAVIVDITRHCRQLQTLNLSLCNNVTDKTVDSLAKYCTDIRRLYLVSCKVTDRALVTLATRSKKLTTLDVGWCEDITEEGVVKISDSCSSLKFLGLMRCDKILPVTADQLENKYPNIRFSNLYLDCKRLVQTAHRQGFISELPPLEPPSTSAPLHLLRAPQLQ